MQGTFVTFGIGGALFALPVAPVVEILEAQDAAPLPRSPDYLLGLIDRRGVSVPVVDFRLLLGQPARDDCPDTRLIVLALSHEGEPRTVGLRVDHVTEVTELDRTDKGPLREADLVHWNERMVAGIGRRHESFVTVIDVDGLFAEDLAALVRARAAA
ncbi:chemotaxis protein CheW [Tropicibacter sp. S64]|uniref:chemotaxis protein CheW n=1 Tax=Tropicibacter sp. S64 TaxID=3415122 RepID=UPI003C79A138